ncbi:transporter substrate-binding domain-containing protein [Candidatus Pelagibacter sp.]|jgi:polar amino acid transport system substrate-binding protein|nr:transporter substrate-binding domain-containing protein [Candidatus Pelagibacter sp.]MDC1053221.1 transporter substrate-binding domain-containing protein [Candidatus Pelagibacter sp.]|tara:strand:+ start:1008 stop:1736 length:729 start_codon:yes stop_codon:yes gene_type:complete
MNEFISNKIAPLGVLRVGLNMSNFLLVSGEDKLGLPEGVSPDVGKKIAEELNVACKLVKFGRPGLLADAVNDDLWDIGNIAHEKERSKTIDFSDPYVNIDANFIYKNKDNFKSNEEINSPGIKIAVAERSAYDLWLTDNFKNVEIIRAPSIDESHNLFRNNKVDVLAGLKPKLIDELAINNDFKIITNPFTFIKQSVGVKKGNPEILEFLNRFISKLIREGYIKKLLKKHKVLDKLSVPKID